MIPHIGYDSASEKNMFKQHDHCRTANKILCIYVLYHFIDYRQIIHY